MVAISIVICTLRRQQALANALSSIARQTGAPIGYEVVVVDNDPDCSSRELVARYAGTIPNLRYSSELSLGLSNARTQGARLAGGEWVVYLDDDCTPEPTFLQELATSLSRRGKVAVVGGPVLPRWPGALPRWLTEDMYPYLSLCNYQGPEDGFKLDFPKQYPVGANIAYPKHLLLEMDGFKPELGRRGDLLLSGEETDLNFRLQRAGYQIWYCPKAIVHHVIPPARLQKGFFTSRSYWDGRTWALLHLHWYGLGRVRRELYYHLSWGLPRKFARIAYFGMIRRNPFLAECVMHEHMGYIVQAMQILRKDDPRDNACSIELGPLP